MDASQRHPLSATGRRPYRLCHFFILNTCIGNAVRTGWRWTNVNRQPVPNAGLASARLVTWRFEHVQRRYSIHAPIGCFLDGWLSPVTCLQCNLLALFW